MLSTRDYYLNSIDIYVYCRTFLAINFMDLKKNGILGARRMAQSGSIASGEDQSTWQLRMRLRSVLIFFEDIHSRIPRFSTIAEDSTRLMEL